MILVIADTRHVLPYYLKGFAGNLPVVTLNLIEAIQFTKENVQETFTKVEKDTIFQFEIKPLGI